MKIKNIENNYFINNNNFYKKRIDYKKYLKNQLFIQLDKILNISLKEIDAFENRIISIIDNEIFSFKACNLKDYNFDLFNFLSISNNFISSNIINNKNNKIYKKIKNYSSSNYKFTNNKYLSPLKYNNESCKIFTSKKLENISEFHHSPIKNFKNKSVLKNSSLKKINK